MLFGPISFVVEDDLPWDEIDHILGDHELQRIDRNTADQAVLATLEEQGSVIVTSTQWFYHQLRRTASQDKGRHSRAGVVLLPGFWALAAPRLIQWLPVIETVWFLRQQDVDRRVVVNLTQKDGIVAIDP